MRGKEERKREGRRMEAGGGKREEGVRRKEGEKNRRDMEDLPGYK